MIVEPAKSTSPTLRSRLEFALTPFLALGILSFALSLLGQFFQSFALMAAGLVICISSLIWTLDYVSQSFVAKSRCNEEAANEAGCDSAMEQLKTSFVQMKERETKLAQQYRLGQCSSEDVLRAKAIALQAEIQWIRESSVLSRARPHRW